MASLPTIRDRDRSKRICLLPSRMKTIPALIDMLVDIARLNDCFIADGGFVSAWVAGLRTALLYAGSTVYVWVQRLT